MKPSIGRIVIIKTTQQYNGSDEHAAVITRVWGEHDEAGNEVGFVNVKVLPDFAAPYDEGSLHLYATRDQALASGQTSRVAWWPERV